MYENLTAVPKTLGQWAPNTSIAGGSFRGEDSVQAERVLAIDEINGTVAETNMQLIDCITSLRGIADSLFGVQPQSAQGEQKNPGSAARLDGLTKNTRDTRALVALVRDQIDRLRQL